MTTAEALAVLLATIDRAEWEGLKLSDNERVALAELRDGEDECDDEEPPTDDRIGGYNDPFVGWTKDLR